MARVLHLLKGDDTALMLGVIARQQAAGDDVGVILLPGAVATTLPAGVRAQRVPDELSYEALLERVFEADQVVTW